MKSLRVSRSLMKPIQDKSKEIHTETQHNPTAKSDREILKVVRDQPCAFLQGSNAPNESKFLVRKSGANGGRGQRGPHIELAGLQRGLAAETNTAAGPRGETRIPVRPHHSTGRYSPEELETGAQISACARRIRTAKTWQQPECLSAQTQREGQTEVADTHGDSPLSHRGAQQG